MSQAVLLWSGSSPLKISGLQAISICYQKRRGLKKKEETF